MEVCPKCCTQFGVDDFAAGVEPGPVWHERAWAVLRAQWLNRIGWPEWALTQLRENIAIDVEALKRKAGRAE